MRSKVSLAALRRRIDRVDDQLLRLLNQRARLVLGVAAQKARRQAEVYAPGRERDVLARLAKQNGGPLSPRLVRGIFREIISASRSLEQQLRVAYFGPEATYTHLAAIAQFGTAAQYVPSSSIADVFADAEQGRADFAVVPVENSTEGMVAHTLDLLVDSPLQIAAEVALPVRHCLLAGPGTALRQVRRAVAHPQALAQCRRWLAAHLPGVAVEEAASNTAAAARAAREPRTAAIAAAEAADVYSLAVLARGIQDEAGNLTRFLVLGTRDAAEPTGDDKTSVVVSVRDEVGVLARLLQPFARHAIDLIKIESRPLRGRPWEYVFYVDILRGEDEAARNALRHLGEVADLVKVLGVYPAA